MPNTLTINTALVTDHWEITGTMSAGTLPAEVFIYTNINTNVLGVYSGVCGLDELSRLQTYTGGVIPIFGNRFIRTNTINIIVSLDTDTTSIINDIVASINLLSTSYKAKNNSTKVFTIL